MSPRQAGRSVLRYVLGGSTILVIIVYAFSFIVEEGTSVVLTRFGKPIGTVTDTGLHFKALWPIDVATRIDTRRRMVTTPHTELLTRDKKNILLMTSAAWHPADPLQFYKAVGTVDDADDKLIGLVTNATIAVLGKYDLSGLVSTDPSKLKLETIERDILLDVNEVSLEKYGIECVSVGFQRVSLPEQNIGFVLEQMRAERRQFAAKYRADGELEAARIRSEADLESARIIAAGEQEAARIKGRADAKVAKIYASAHGKAPEFYRFVRSLESLDQIVGANTRVILRTDVEPFNLLKESSLDPLRGLAVPKELEFADE